MTSKWKRKQQTNGNREIWFIELIQTRVVFGWLSERSGWNNSCPRTFLTSYYNTIGQLNNAFFHIRFFLGGKTKSTCFDKTNNEHLPKSFFKVKRNRSIEEYCCFKSVAYHQGRSWHETLGCKAGQGLHGSLKTWKVMKFKNLFSRPKKSKNFIVGPGKSWEIKVMFWYISYCRCREKQG